MIMRRILIVCAAYPPDVKGGGEKSTQILAQALTARGHTVSVLACAELPGSHLDVDNRTRITRISSPNLYWNFKTPPSGVKKAVWHALENFNPRSVSAVVAAIRAARPDVVISSTIENFGAGVWLACRQMGVPVIHVLRSYYLKCFKGTMFNDNRNCGSACWSCRVMTMGRRHAAQYVSGVVGISDFILDEHADLFGAAQRISIPNAVPANTAVTRLRGSNDVVTFGYLGRIEPEKGIAQILQAFSQLPDRCHLVIAGHGKPDYEAQLRREFASERIRFLGWVDAASVYSSIDFAVIPSVWNEPFGRVVIEAYAQGVPVIAAKSGGLSELVKESQTGYLFDPTDVDAFVAACRRAVDNIANYAQMADAARCEASRYAPPQIALRYETFIESVLCRLPIAQPHGTPLGEKAS